jgi:Protein of unknown function (DUF3108)
MMHVIAALATTLVVGKAPAPPSEPPTLPPVVECTALPSIKHPFVFSSGEILEYSIDVQGARVAKLTFKVLPLQQDALPLRVEGKTNTFANKIRRISFSGTSYVDPRTLYPLRYVEESIENMRHRQSRVTFDAKNHVAVANIDEGGERYEFNYARDKLDMIGLFYFLRQVSLRQNASICLDIFGLRHLARVFVAVGRREHLSLPIGEFEAWHLQAQVVRLDNQSRRYEVQAWVSDDDRRLPVVLTATARGVTSRATLTSIVRPERKRQRAEGSENLKW